jgi:VCBS repeat-containing protein
MYTAVGSNVSNGIFQDNDAGNDPIPLLGSMTYRNIGGGTGQTGEIFAQLDHPSGSSFLIIENGYTAVWDNVAETVTTSGSNVYVNNVLVGTYALDQNLGGAFPDALFVDFAGTVGADIAGVVLQSIFYQNTATIRPSETATVSFQVEGAPPNVPSVSIHVAALGTPVAAANDAFTVAENATLTGHNVFADNGSGADSGSGFTVTAVDGFAAAVGTQIALASGAHLILNANGTFSYDPNHAFDSVPLGATATDTFNYTITGGSTAIDTITITGVDHAPVITSNGGGATASVSIQEHTAAVTTAHATDLEAQTLTYAIAGGADQADFQINANTGALAFVTAPDFAHPTDADHNNSYIVQVSASDGTLVTDQTLTVNVASAPPVAANDAFTVAENATLTGHNVFADNGSGADTGTGFAVTAVDGFAAAVGSQIMLGSGAHLTLNADGTFSYDPNHAFDRLAAGATGTDNFNYTITGGSTAVATVTIVGVDNAPDITSSGGGVTASISVAEHSTAVTTVQATDIDSPTLTYAIAGGADQADFQIDATSGALAFVTAPDFAHPTDADHNNSYIVQVSASDGTLVTDQTITVNVTNANEAPVIDSNGGGDSASVSIPENTTAVTTVHATDPDADTTLAYSISGGADAARFNINGSTGALSFASPPNFEVPTDSDHNNSYLVQVRASDGSLTDDQAITVNVTDVPETVHWMQSVDIGAHPAGWLPSGFGDYNNDGTSDVLWYNAGNGDAEVWKIGNGQWAGSVDIGLHPAGYTPSGPGDFNHDGTSDVFWFNPTTRDTDIWRVNNGQWAGSTTLGVHPAGYQPAGIGDFNHDGTSDVFWFNPTTNDTDIWLVNNAQWAGSTSLGAHPAGYQVAGIGDFNHDGTSDVLWFNPTTRDTDIWLVNNGQWAGSTTIGTHPAGYQIAGTGDFNQDGTSDVVWYNPSNNDVDVWLVQNGHWAGSVGLGAHPAGSQLMGVGDFDHNGVADIMWRDTSSGHIETWLLAYS